MEQTDAALLVDTNCDDKSSWVVSPVLGSFVIDIANRTELSGPLSLCIEHVVRTHVTNILQKVAQHDARFHGKLIPSGSFYEGTKVSTPNEFDYMYELSSFQSDTVTSKHVLPPIYRPTQEETPHRGYFTLEVIPQTADSSANLASNDTCQFLDAEVYFREFFEFVENITRRQNQNSSENTMLSMINVKRNGPAVTLSFVLNKTVVLESRKCPQTSHSSDLVVALSAVKPKEVRNFNSIIKVDIVLAIPMLVTKLKLEDGHIQTSFNEEEEPEMLHLVPSGNCWKLSVAKEESRLIRSFAGVSWQAQESIIDACEPLNSNIQTNDSGVNVIHSEEGACDNEITPCVVEMGAYGVGDESIQSQASSRRPVAEICRRSCLIALKNLRDEQEIGDLMKKAILPTYPLKVAFLQECREHFSDEDWKEDQLGRRVANILDKLDTECRDGSLTGCLLPNVPILKSPDYNISKQVHSIIGSLNYSYRMYMLYSALLLLTSVMSIFLVSWILADLVNGAVYLCCSHGGLVYLNETGRRCILFNAYYPCRDGIGYFSSEPVYLQLGGEFVNSCAWARSVLYTVVFLIRIVTLKCRFGRKLNFVCIPVPFQFIPVVTSVLRMVITNNIRVHVVEVSLFVMAAFEAVYLFYETACLISICLLMKRRHPIGHCIGPFRKCARLQVKRQSELYFEYISKYT